MKFWEQVLNGDLKAGKKDLSHRPDYDSPPIELSAGRHPAPEAVVFGSGASNRMGHQKYKDGMPKAHWRDGIGPQ